jgi:hypothetical protein
MTADLAALTSTNEWMGWFSADPRKDVRESVESMLRKQSPTARLDWIHLEGVPYFLHNAAADPADPTTKIVRRAGFAVSFVLEVDSAGTGEPERLSGTFSWVATGLDGKRKEQTFIDLNEDPAWAKKQLVRRINKLTGEQAAVGGGS